MLGLMLNRWTAGAGLLAGALAAALWIDARAYDRGSDAAEARAALARAHLETRLAARTAALEAATAEIARARAAAAAEIERIETDARQDPDAARRALSADSLDRLRRRFGAR